MGSKFSWGHLLILFHSAALHLLLLLFILMFIFAIIGYNFFGYDKKGVVEGIGGTLVWPCYPCYSEWGISLSLSPSLSLSLSHVYAETLTCIPHCICTHTPSFSVATISTVTHPHYGEHTHTHTFIYHIIYYTLNIMATGRWLDWSPRTAAGTRLQWKWVLHHCLSIPRTLYLHQPIHWSRHYGQSVNLLLKNSSFIASSPGSPPPLCFIRAIFIYVKLLSTQGRGRAWAALITCGHWWRIQCPLCPHMRVEKNKKEARISVLLGFLERSTEGSIIGQDSQLMF